MWQSCLSQSWSELWGRSVAATSMDGRAPTQNVSILESEWYTLGLHWS